MRASALRDEAAEVNAELRSLRERKTNIPQKQLELRAGLCRELRMGEDALPFAGELIAVRESEADWEGAAERLLHGFALSVLVPDEHYAAVSDWINGHHLGDRVVYYRVPEPSRGRGSATPVWAGHAGRQAAGQGHPVRRRGWNRNLAGAPTSSASRRWPSSAGCTRAITRAGQVKGSRGRHEKDDRYRIDDRSRYVLGWTNERKIEALLDRAGTLATARLSEVAAEQQRHEKARDAAVERGQVLAGLDQTHEFAEIDWQSVVDRDRGAPGRAA